MASDRADYQDWRDAGLLLIGHGSSRVRGGGDQVRGLARAIRARRLFAQVTACFLKEAPSVGEGLRRLRPARVFAVPVLAGEGHYSREEIPRALGLSGEGGRERRDVHYCGVVGAHPGIPAIVARRADTVIAANGLDPGQVGVLLVGHGSRHPGGGGGMAAPVADALAALTRYGEVRAAYLEEEPRISEWPRLMSSRLVVVVPLLVAEGRHRAEDILPHFGLAPGATGPAVLAGRTIWCAEALGAGREMADIVLDLVSRAGRS